MLKGTCPARSGQRCNQPWFAAPGLLKVLMVVSFVTRIWWAAGGDPSRPNGWREMNGRRAPKRERESVVHH